MQGLTMRWRRGKKGLEEVAIASPHPLYFLLSENYRAKQLLIIENIFFVQKCELWE